MPIHKAWVMSCAKPKCRSRPLVLYEQFVRTDLRTAEKMAREAGWLKVGGDWFCGAQHAAVAYLEVKRARSVKRAPRATQAPLPAAPARPDVASETPADGGADTTQGTEETLIGVAADGRDG